MTIATENPPDEWEVEEPVPPPGRGQGQKSFRPGPEILSPDAAAVRTLWITAVRAYHQARSGKPSKYNSCPAWDGGWDANSARTYSKAIWPEFVAKARAAGYSPRELVMSLFATWASDSAPTPRHAISEANLARATADRQSRRRRIADALRTEEAVFRADLFGLSQSIPDPREAARRVLNDTGRGLSSLFRYSVAVIRNLPDVADRWEKAAMAQFQNDAKVYMELWSALIPDKIKKTVSSV